MLTKTHDMGTIVATYTVSNEWRRNMDVFEQVKAIVVDLLEVDPEEVTLEASFRENLEADSLDLVELLMAFEETFGSPIPDEDVKTIVTVGDAVSYIQKQLTEKG
jgi:acyl carrier protein